MLYKRLSNQKGSKVDGDKKQKSKTEKDNQNHTSNQEEKAERDETVQQMKRQDYNGDDEDHLPGIHRNSNREEAKDESYGIKDTGKKSDKDPLNSTKNQEDKKQNESGDEERPDRLPPISNVKTVEQDSK